MIFTAEITGLAAGFVSNQITAVGTNIAKAMDTFILVFCEHQWFIQIAWQQGQGLHITTKFHQFFTANETATKEQIFFLWPAQNILRWCKYWYQ
jgi:hypothetical protein